MNYSPLGNKIWSISTAHIAFPFRTIYLKLNIHSRLSIQVINKTDKMNITIYVT